jgi:flagellar basal-body rod modification protein FlgD
MESLQSLTQQTAASTSAMESMQVLALGAQVGSTVTAVSDHVVLDTDKVAATFTLKNAATTTSVVLTGSDKVEHRIELGTRAPGEVNFSIDPAALGLAKGTYALRVETDIKEVPAVGVSGVLGSVKLSATGGIVLNVSHLGEVAPSAVTQFNGRPSSSIASN